ncbi:MAG TPA: hypothetical protein VFM46_15800, partial [Pseudomonadales bacterium]|nr:hypothetical protein [Pseudomonadales bacterium]
MLTTPYQQFIHLTRYSRWLDSLGRRETWPETVDRYCQFFDDLFEHEFKQTLWNEIQPAILKLDVMPSMRAMMTAGEALKRENLAGYNCSYLAINNKRAFSEALYLLMCGVGVGFSCERQEINKLPTLPETLAKSEDIIAVADSKLGWAKAFKKLLSMLWEGDIPKVDYSQIRPAGARLKTFGGRASGPEPLKRLFSFVVEIFRRAAGRKLTSIEVHDILCMIGEIVVVGGVRRSALISLSNLSDQRMRDAKAGQWWQDNPQRALANNSVAYTEKPASDIFMEEWLALVKSKSGERGIFNRVAAQKQAARWGRRDPTLPYGCNPCSEIILRDKQLCNLSEVVIRASDTLEDILHKVRIATMVGTFQATLTEFNFVGEDWVKNTRQERLLGVSLTGIFDHPVLAGKEGPEILSQWLNRMREQARETNKDWAKRLGISESAAITCVKPSGTVSQLCDSASGIHPRHAQHYLRSVRLDKKDPVFKLLHAQGVYFEDDYLHPQTTAVFFFPQHAPAHAQTRSTVSTMQHLDLWLTYQREWCEHKPSVTISVKDEEWLEVGA